MACTDIFYPIITICENISDFYVLTFPKLSSQLTLKGTIPIFNFYICQKIKSISEQKSNIKRFIGMDFMRGLQRVMQIISKNLSSIRRILKHKTGHNHMCLHQGCMVGCFTVILLRPVKERVTLTYFTRLFHELAIVMNLLGTSLFLGGLTC